MVEWLLKYFEVRFDLMLICEFCCKGVFNINDIVYVDIEMDICGIFCFVISC